MTPDAGWDAELPEPPVSALRWRGAAADGTLGILDQTRLPVEEVWNERTAVEEVEADILRLAVRGAPAIGVAAAYGLVLAARTLASPSVDPAHFARRFEDAAQRLAATRPTAVNLRVAVARSLERWRTVSPPPSASPALLLEAARDLEAYEASACADIARAGAALLAGRRRILTHCNAGALVAPGLGTALAPIYALHARGDEVFVWVDETRPLLQGLRLTAWELARGGVPHAVVVEGAAPSLFAAGRVDAVITGADRVAANGDVANKVGTYGLAVLCRHHGVPFYVAAPLSTLDPTTPSGGDIPVEQRAGDGRRYLLPEAVGTSSDTWEPAFDVTPAALVTALLTDRGVLEAPEEDRLAPWMTLAARLQRDAGAGR